MQRWTRGSHWHWIARFGLNSGRWSVLMSGSPGKTGEKSKCDSAKTATAA